MAILADPRVRELIFEESVGGSGLRGLGADRVRINAPGRAERVFAEAKRAGADWLARLHDEDRDVLLRA
jgi:hypothetical protein